MEIKLKNIELSKNNREDATEFGNTIDLYVERLNKLQKLQDDNCNDIEYSRKIFSMYEVRFDEGNISCYYNGVWTFLSYDIAYYELDLEHVYIKEEIDFLVKSGKIVLLSSKPYVSVDYQESFENETNEQLDTIENYDFSNMNNNSRLNNRVVTNMINEHFDKSKLKESIDSERHRLIEMLESYRSYAIQMSTYHSGNALDYKELLQVCDDKIKKLVAFI